MPSSATSTATRSGCSTPTSAPSPRAAISWCSPSSTVTGYPPEDLLLRPAFVAAACGDASPSSRREPGDCAAVDRLPRAERRRPLQRGRRVRRRASRSACTASSCSRTTRCSTSSGTSRPSTDAGPLFDDRGREGRGVDLRGRVEPGADRGDGRERRRARRQHQRVAVLRGPAARARGDARRARAVQARRADRLRQPRRRSGRARVRRRVARVRRARARSSRARSSSRRTCSSSTSRISSPVPRPRRAGARAACTRSTRRSCSARATTCARTASTTC